MKTKSAATAAKVQKSVNLTIIVTPAELEFVRESCAAVLRMVTPSRLDSVIERARHWQSLSANAKAIESASDIVDSDVAAALALKLEAIAPRSEMIDLPRDLAARLQAAAQRLGTTPEQLLHDSLTSLFKDSDETVIAAVKGGAR